jgi:hypothetical protein
LSSRLRVQDSGWGGRSRKASGSFGLHRNRSDLD